MAVIKVVIDANVLYSSFTRDLLLSLFSAAFYEAKWTDEINDEWVRHLLENRSNINPANVKRTLRLMNSIQPNPIVADYKHIIEQLSLPDKDDRHVLAAAIACGAKKILTWNLKDFPEKFLKEFGILAENPDKFLATLISEDPISVANIFRSVRVRQNRPPLDIAGFLSALQVNSLTQTYHQIERYRNYL